MAFWRMATGRGPGRGRALRAQFPESYRKFGSVRSIGKEDGREYELKPSIVIQRVQFPPGKGRSASRKSALRVTAMVARSVGEQVPKLRESASKSECSARAPVHRSCYVLND
jgi:hypothetical protein